MGMDKDQLLIDLGKLYTWGAILLPDAADTYSAAATKVFDSSTGDEAYKYCGSVPQVVKTWCEMRDLLQSDIMCTTADNMIATAKNMELYAFEIAAMDDDLKGDLIDKAQNDLVNTDDYAGQDPDSIDPEALAQNDPAPGPPDIKDK